MAGDRQLVRRSTQIAALLVCAMPLLFISGEARGSGIGVYDVTGFAAGDSFRGIGQTGQWVEQGVGFEGWLGRSISSTAIARFRVQYRANFDLAGSARHTAGFGIGVQLGGPVDYGDDVRLDYIMNFDASPFTTGLAGRVDMGLGAGVTGWIMGEDVALFAELLFVLHVEIAKDDVAARPTVGPQLNAGLRFRFD